MWVYADIQYAGVHSCICVHVFMYVEAELNFGYESKTVYHFFFLSQGLSLGPRAHRLVQCGWPVNPRNLRVSSSSDLSLKPPHLPFSLGARD